MRRAILAVAIIGLFVVLLTMGNGLLTTTGSTADPASFVFYVQDSATFAPIVGATCKMGNLTGTTDAYGVYAFMDIPPGVYTMAVSANGYDTYTKASIEIATINNDYTSRVRLVKTGTGGGSGNSTITGGEFEFNTMSIVCIAAMVFLVIAIFKFAPLAYHYKILLALAVMAMFGWFAWEFATGGAVL